jgi:hypothetical protein
MKKLMLSLLVAGAMSIPASAMAIVPETPYAAFITTGPVGTPVGFLFFSLLADVPRTACIFDVEWDSDGVFGISTELVMDELKVQGNISCASALAGAHSVLTLDGTWGPQFGFDRFRQIQPVGALILGEDGDALQASGIIQFGTGRGPTLGVIPTFVNGFEIVVAP